MRNFINEFFAKNGDALACGMILALFSKVMDILLSKKFQYTQKVFESKNKSNGSCFMA